MSYLFLGNDDLCHSSTPLYESKNRVNISLNLEVFLLKYILNLLEVLISPSFWGKSIAILLSPESDYFVKELLNYRVIIWFGKDNNYIYLQNRPQYFQGIIAIIT